MYSSKQFYRACIFINHTCKLLSLKTQMRHLSFSYSSFQKCAKTKKHKVEGPPWKVLFFGTDNFSLESLKPLCSKLWTGTLMSSLGVVTKRGSKIRKFAEAEKLQVYDWPLASTDLTSDYDVGMVVSFGNLIPKSIIDGLPLGCINVHASLLPRWRGASPIIHSIMNGDTETGVTIMRVHPHRFDVGEIVRQYRVSIGPEETAEQLEHKLSVLGAQLLMECLRDMPRCIERAVPQPEQGITYAPKISSLSASVDWRKMGANYVYNLHRALKHIYPLTTRWMGHRVKLQEVEIDKDSRGITPRRETGSGASPKSALAFLNSGSVECPDKVESSALNDPGKVKYLKDQKCLRVICSDNRCVIVRKISISGKTMSAVDFYNGFLTKEDENTWRFTE